MRELHTVGVSWKFLYLGKVLKVSIQNTVKAIQKPARSQMQGGVKICTEIFCLVAFLHLI